MTNANEGPALELDAGAMRTLLDELDERLRGRGVAASVYVVGGAAMALAYGREGVTPDIDAVASHRAVMEEARALAETRGLSEHWLNDSAAPWIPPPPKAAMQRPDDPGLVVHLAPPEHVLAMKLVALRRKDRPDILILVRHLRMEEASPDEYADLLERVYSGEGRLATVLGIPGDDTEAIREEALAIGQWVHEFCGPLRD